MKEVSSTMRPPDTQDPGTLSATPIRAEETAEPMAMGTTGPEPAGTDPATVEDRAVAQLLRSVAPVAPIPERVRQRVRRAAHDEWQTVATSRRRRRRSAIAGGLLAASLAAFLLAPEAWLPWSSGAVSRAPLSRAPLATLEAITGSVSLTAALESEAASISLQPGDALLSAHSVETGTEGRIAFRLAAGHALRVDTETHLEILDDDVISLHRGAVYVDSAPSAAGPDGLGPTRPIEIRTPWGVARDVGTQFEVRVGPDDLRVRVREGRVEIDGEGGAVRRAEARAGTEITLTHDGDLERKAIPNHGPEWGWNLEIAPTFALEGATLDDFLDWLVRETGWTLELADPVIAQRARSTVLHGDLEGIPIERTPDFVLATCGLRHELRDATLWIDHLP